MSLDGPEGTRKRTVKDVEAWLTFMVDCAPAIQKKRQPGNWNTLVTSLFVSLITLPVYFNRRIRENLSRGNLTQQYHWDSSVKLVFLLLFIFSVSAQDEFVRDLYSDGPVPVAGNNFAKYLNGIGADFRKAEEKLKASGAAYEVPVLR